MFDSDPEEFLQYTDKTAEDTALPLGFPGWLAAVPDSPEKKAHSGRMGWIVEDVSDAVNAHGLTNSRLGADR